MTYTPRVLASDDLHPCLTAAEIAVINTAYPTSKVPLETVFATTVTDNGQTLKNIVSRQIRKNSQGN